MKKIHVLLVAIFAITSVYAQTATTTRMAVAQTTTTSGSDIPDAGVSLSNPIPASPDAAALGKYGSIPVSPYTGTPNITIPLYTVKSGDLSLPISLSYHSSGNRVEEMASSVGLGWVLNAGGVITRTIRGKPDEEYNGFLTQVSAAQIKTLLSTPNLTATQQSQLDYYLNATADGTLDSEPDIYNYNFGGYSGQFMMDGQGHISVMPLQNIIFTFNIYSGQTTYINSFTAKTPDGATYYFGATGATGPIEFTNAAGSNVQHAISWYLYKITSPSFHEIDFTYTPESYGFVTSAQQTFYQWIGSTGCWGANCSGGIKNAPQNVQNQTVSNNFNNVKLSSITFENGRIQIYAANSRNDINSANKAIGAKCIDTIAITSPGFSKLYKFYYLNTTTSRLRLDSLIGQLEPIAGTGNFKKEKYSFTYNPDAWNGNYMFLFSQDYWGYYNAQGNQYAGEGILVPNLTVNLGGVPTALPGANRAPNGGAMLAGMLTQITYPTSGYTRFTYEANTESNTYVGDAGASCGISNQVAFSNDSACVYFNYDARNNNLHNIMTVYGIGQTPLPITVSAYGFSGPNAPSQFDNIRAAVYSYNASTGDSTLYAVINNTGTNCGTARDSTIYLPPGTYKLSYADNKNQHYTPSNPNGYKIALVARWCSLSPAQIQAETNNYPAGGLRIQQIADYDGLSTKPINLRTYKYLLPGSTSSSGWLDFQPVYTFQLNIETTAFNMNSPVASWVDEYLTRSSVSNYPLGSTQGAVVGYSHVEELFGANGENGKNEYFFTNAQTNPDLLQGTGINFPFAPSANQDWHRGLMLKQTTWKNTGNGTFAKLSEQASAYSTVKNNFNNYGIKAGFNPKPYGYSQYTSYYSNPLISELGRIVESTYLIGSDYTYRSSDTSRTYDQNDPTKFLQTVSTYQIDPTTYQIKQVQSTNSNNELITKTVTYPGDYQTFANPSNGSLVGVQNLYNMGITTFPIEEVTQKSNLDGSNSRTIKAVLTTYKPNRAYRDSIFEMRSVTDVTGFVNSSPGTNNIARDSHYQPVVVFNKYDTYGNILQESNSGDATHTYIWGYNSTTYPYNYTYPVAEVVNADSANVAYTNFEQLRNSGSTWGNWAFPFAGITSDATAPMGPSCYSVTSTNTLTKTGLSAATTYVVSFWSKSGAAITVTGGTVTNVATGNAKSGWYYHEYQVTGTATVTLAGTGLVDEVRLYPVNAQMNSFAYTTLVGISSKCDNKSYITYYTYDNVGRLNQVLDPNKNIIKDYQYNYASQGPTWQDNGTTQCETNIYGNTGIQDKQQKDVNPYSPTYGLTRWVVAGQNLTACPLPPPPIYVKMKLSSSYISVDTFNTYEMDAYSDAACTQPYTVTSALTVNFIVTITNHSTGVVTTCPQSVVITAGTNHVLTGSIDVTGCITCGGAGGSSNIPVVKKASVTQVGTGGSTCSSTVTLTTGSGYTAK